MEVETRLLWIFVTIAMVPTASLSAVYAHYSKELADSVGLVYSLSVEERKDVTAMHDDLAQIDSDIRLYIESQDAARKRILADNIMQASKSFIARVDAHQKEAQEDMEMQRALGAEHYSSEKQFIDGIKSEWDDYIFNINTILAMQPREDYVPIAHSILRENVPMSDSMHQNINGLDTNSEKTLQLLVEKSTDQYRMSQFYGTLTSASAAATAILISILVVNKYHITFQEKHPKNVQAGQESNVL
ncbi:hypothetical protein [Nitrososphaera sp.]|uniref:hypothetical protein n=1 Tax=Nitrososphaera sp. TaxID=1971748 RepID=UPI00183FE4F3|nr:hypothetical protein [Nitrososphaera sp.]NWG38191.1 hypothetical protein [Nitrososphaera sp.]